MNTLFAFISGKRYADLVVEWNGNNYLIPSEAVVRKSGQLGRDVPVQTLYTAIRRKVIAAVAVPGARLLLLLPEDVDAWDVADRPGRPKKKVEETDDVG